MTSSCKIAQLLGKLENGSEFEAYEAAKCLSGLKGAKVLTELIRILRLGKQPYARQAAAYALSWQKNRRAVDSLLACAANPGERDSVKGQALEGLTIHLERASARSSLRLKAEKLIFCALRSSSPTLRFWACFGLGTLGCERAIPRLHKIAVADTELCPGWWYVREDR